MNEPWYQMEKMTIKECEDNLSKFYSKYLINKILKKYNDDSLGSYRCYYTFIEPKIINDISEYKNNAEKIIQRFFIHKVLPLYKSKNKIDNN
tara:strand:+ start:222 stop:497 length:276 start_codon:yes stop_codon:yes gene_type:complete